MHVPVQVVRLVEDVDSLTEHRMLALRWLMQRQERVGTGPDFLASHWRRVLPMPLDPLMLVQLKVGVWECVALDRGLFTSLVLVAVSHPHLSWPTRWS